MKSNNTGLYIGIGIVVLAALAIALYVYYPGSSIIGGNGTDTTTNTDGTTNSDGSTGPTSGLGKPTVMTTSFAGVVATTSVVVAGVVIPHGAATEYWFEYGSTTPKFTMSTEHKSAGAGSASTTETAYIGGLKPGTTYYFRMGAQNSAGIGYGGVQSFITAAK